MKIKCLPGRPQHQNQFQPPHKKVIFDTHTKQCIFRTPTKTHKLISTPSLKPSQFRPHSNIKSILMPRHKIQVNLDHGTKNKAFPTATPKASQFRFLRRNRSQFPSTSLKSSQFRRLRNNQVMFGLERKKQVNFGGQDNNQENRPPH